MISIPKSVTKASGGVRLEDLPDGACRIHYGDSLGWETCESRLVAELKLAQWAARRAASLAREVEALNKITTLVMEDR